MTGSMSSRGRLLLAGLLAVAVGISAGCGSGSNSKVGTVKGKVQVNGVPANAGNVIFTLPDGGSMAGAIQPDGTYTALDVPVGTAQVTVIGPPPVRGVANVPLPGGGKDVPVAPGMGTTSKPIPIPAKYGKAATSGLSHTVKSGTTTFDIDLK